MWYLRCIHFKNRRARHTLFQCSLRCSYFCFVASPPRMCRSCLFCAITPCTSSDNDGATCGSFVDISLCTVDFDIPKCFAVLRTVARCATMYSPSRIARRFNSSLLRVSSRTLFFKSLTPCALTFYLTLCSFPLVYAISPLAFFCGL